MFEHHTEFGRQGARASERRGEAMSRQLDRRLSLLERAGAGRLVIVVAQPGESTNEAVERHRAQYRTPRDATYVVIDTGIGRASA